MGIYYSLAEDLRTKFHENIIKAATTDPSNQNLVDKVFNLLKDPTIATAENDWATLRTLYSMANQSDGTKYVKCIVNSYGF